jgi:GntR family transcriptional regulator/MocR family aminotransferase
MALQRVHGDRILTIPVEQGSGVPVYRQVYLGVRQAILVGKVTPGSRLPSTRALASDLGVSRNTVVMAYEQLRGEGYTVGRGGSDTRVAGTVPDSMMQSGAAAARPRSRTAINKPSMTARAIERTFSAMAPRLEMPPRAFRAGVPATDLFPYSLWGRLLSRRWNRVTHRDLGYGNPQGYLPLREAIASYLASARGVVCDPGQIFIVGGAQGALSVAARTVLDQGDKAWIEDPGYHGARGALIAAGATVVPVPVDAEGIDVAEGIHRAPDARVAFVTPSRQLPLGMALSPARRTALLAWAAKQKSWIIEDDYDSEIRFASRPLPALQADDTNGCVLYVGTFSKVLFPALRLGYLVVPPDLVNATLAVRHMQEVHSPTLEQTVLADFIAGGHFERHVRRVRQVYLERQQVLRDAVKRQLSGVLTIPPGEAGLFVTAWLHGMSDVAGAAAAAAAGVDVMPLSRMSEGTVKPGFVLGYAGLNVTDIAEGVQRLAGALLPLRSGAKR